MAIRCANPGCPFNGTRSLPILTVDEVIYRRLPAFIIATVDKFAGLPWLGEAGAFFGHVDREGQWGFYRCGPERNGNAALRRRDAGAPGAHHPGRVAPYQRSARHCRSPLRGGARPAGTRTWEDKRVRAKIVASTATVRRAGAQIQALFDRHRTEVFPPPGLNRRDSFFATTVPPSQRPARLYVGLAAPGKGPKLIFLRALIALLAAAEKEAQAGGDADPYLTALCYFNALRELGGARRIVEDEVRAKLATYGTERRRIAPPDQPFANRRLRDVLELTSRESTDKVAAAKEALAKPCADPKQGVDVALATNMISVGLDIGRLGLMVVQGQPKAAAEYIQATSRVGRLAEKPGFVLALLNAHKPRDRLHYEGFRHFHELNTIGIVAVAALAAIAGKVPPMAQMTATRRLTRSAASAGRRSFRPSAQRYSIFTFWPSTKPVSLRPGRNGAKVTLLLADDGPRKPITGTLGCCASSTSMPTAPRPPPCGPIDCAYGLPQWPTCCSVPCAVLSLGVQKGPPCGVFFWVIGIQSGPQG
jgi:hypothetical protein